VDNINEGGVVTYSVITENITNGTVFNYVSAGNVSNTDLTPMSGSVTIINNRGIFSVDTLADSTTEGAETFMVKLYLGNELVATSANVAINDTSLSPIYPGATYEVKSNADEVPEGGVVVFVITTTNIPDETVFNYSIAGSFTSDNLTPTAGVVIVTNNTGVFSIDTSVDYLARVKVFMAKVYLGGNLVAGSTNVNILQRPEPTEAPTAAPTEPPLKTYSIRATGTSVNEGQSAIFNIVTKNVPDETELEYDLTGTIDGNDVSITAGTVVINDDRGIFVVTILLDHLTEGVESFIANLYDDGLFVAATANITITDSSLTITAAPTLPPTLPPTLQPTAEPNYSITCRNTVNEGSKLSVTAKTNIKMATGYSWSIVAGEGFGGIDVDKMSGGLNMSTGQAIFYIDIKNDSVTDPNETFTISLLKGNVVVAVTEMVTITETAVSEPPPSVTPTVTNLSVVPTKISEGESVSCVATTSGYADNDEISWSTTGATAFLDSRFISGNATVYNNSATWTILSIKNNITDETKTVGVIAGGASASFDINYTKTTNTPTPERKVMGL